MNNANTMRRLIGITALVCTFSSAADDAPSLLGFSAAGAARQHALETDFRALLSAQDQSRWAAELAAHPHHAGSPHTRSNVAFIAALFRDWGFEVTVEEFDILLPVPKERLLELLEPTTYRAALVEDIVDQDASSTERDEVLAPYNAFSPDGDVTGELVFVNYGIPEDYEVLARYGIDVAGKIVIAKYGRSWRGIKPKLAAEKGAIGTLIYSDPADDGYARGDVYPTGAFKNDSGVQRGSVMDMPLYPGDVLTPGEPAIKGTRRLSIAQAETIAKVPVLPISYRDAEPLLSALGGETVPREWQGALPITYHLGPGPAKVHLKVSFDWQRITIQNVIARLPGTQFPDQWVLRGNHHDAWNHGAADPVSGMVALLSEAQAVGALARAGRAPRRTLVYAAWDAEEPGLIGSTEWVEKHYVQLREKAVVYLNTDGNGRGFASVGGSHTLESFFDEVLGSVSDPQTSVSLGERLRASRAVNGSPEQREEIESRSAIRINPLGSGSDYTPFLQHAGIASANLAFGGESAHGSYHTLYDTFEHFVRFRDPGFSYGVALADMAGTATLRLANAEVLPFRFAGLVDNLQLYVKQVEELAEEQRKEADRINSLLAAKTYALALDPAKSFGPPAAKKPVPHFNFAELKNAMERLAQVSESLDSALLPGEVSATVLAQVNRQLYMSERALTAESGLPGRQWYRHQIYAPGFYTGYGVKTLPRIREAIEAELYTTVDAEIALTAAVLFAFADHLDGIEALLQEPSAD